MKYDLMSFLFQDKLGALSLFYVVVKIRLVTSHRDGCDVIATFKVR